MGLYDLHKYLYTLANDLDEQNRSRLQKLINATRNAQYYNYVSENLNTPFRYDENIGMSDPSENRSKRYANHRAPQDLPPRHDLRKYDNENNLGKKKQPSFYRLAKLSDLPNSILVSLNRHIAKDYKGGMDTCLIRKENNETLVIAKESYVGNEPISMFKKEIKVSKKDKDYEKLNAVWQKAKVSKIKISRPIRALDKTEKLGFEVNTYFYKLVKKARRDEKNI